MKTPDLTAMLARIARLETLAVELAARLAEADAVRFAVQTAVVRLPA